MKKYFACIAICLTFIACVKHPPTTPVVKPGETPSLKILAIGNSFTEDGLEYLPALLQAEKFSAVKVGRMISAGSSLEDHRNNYASGAPGYIFKVRSGNNWSTISNKASLSSAVKFEDWDIIVLQQVSQLSGVYSSYQPFLNELMTYINNDRTNTKMIYAWQMTWAYATNSTHSGFSTYGKNQQTMYNQIVSATQQMSSATGINLIIPTGTAIQNLRNTSLNNAPDDITRDGYHLDFGAGRYTASCTWFQALVSPVPYGVDVTNNTFRTVSLGNIPVTSANFDKCQLAAYRACQNKYTVYTGN